MIDLVRVLEGDIRDQERIIAADQAILCSENSQAIRLELMREISKAKEKIEHLKRKIESIKNPAS
jgi:hypothetical protein